ncbi:MAG: aromatic ring hydroxylase, partial [Chloroflexota bacterium]
MNEQRTQVLIVGAGPTGLTASLLLSKLGIDHVLVEKRLSAQAAPAAHVINRRTLEIFRQCGLSMDRIYGLDKHGSSSLVIRWGMGITGATIGQLTASVTHHDSESG